MAGIRNVSAPNANVLLRVGAHSLGKYVRNLHFAANSLAADSSRAVDSGTSARRLVYSRLPVADIGAAVGIEAVAGLVAVAFVRQTVVSGKSVATGQRCVRDAYRSGYFVDELAPTILVAPKMAASAMWG